MTLSKYDVNTATRMVDNWRERNPGSLDDKPLVLVGVQKERRLRRLFKGRIKYFIFKQEGTGNIWYKRKMDSVGAVKMGFSVKRLANHPTAVPMEFYFEVFVHPSKLIPLSHLPEGQKKTLRSLIIRGDRWLELHGYELVGSGEGR